jgi:hypothetical protein
MVSRSSDQVERKRTTVAKKVSEQRKTRASKGTNPVLRDGHPQDVAHPATVEEAESSSRWSYIVLPLLWKRQTLSLP